MDKYIKKFSEFVNEAESEKEIYEVYIEIYIDNKLDHKILAGTFSDFKKAIDKAESEKEKRIKSKTDEVGIIEVGSNTKKFAIIYINDKYLKHMKSYDIYDSWRSKKSYKIYIDVAEKCLKSGKTQIGDYGHKLSESIINEGKSKTLNFHIEVKHATKNIPKTEAFGGDSLKEIAKWAIAEKKEDKNFVYYKCIPQTVAGERQLKGKDFAIIDGEGVIDYYNKGDKIPMYTF